MIFGVQYFRPPFPIDKYWDDDFRRIRETGLNAVQLWVLWSWVEATPGAYRWDDYDRLVELAGKHGIGVVLSAIGEVQPYWIHREVPGSEMVTRSGHAVVSSNRNEIHHGITPGGCFDHPEVWRRMAAFMSAVVQRYKGSPAVVGWDCWNELRWNVQADDMVCYCEHTIESYHRWLDRKFGGLGGLNAAWLRRHSAWDEVRPGKMPGRPYTDMMAFQHFLTERSNQHGIARYRLIKEIDPSRPVTLHAGEPCVYSAGHQGWGAWAIDRGNDWAFADHIDGVGTSSFPAWGRQDDTEYALRLECIRSAAGNKDVWLSELQGGRAASGFDVHQSVSGRMQQRWVWNGAAIGAETIVFWCWRDEVFGQESAGFGIVGDDGCAPDRVAALRKTGAVLQKHRDLLAAYQPAKPSVGLFFSPQTYYLCFAQEGQAGKARNSLFGYGRALLRNNIPFSVVEEEHLDSLGDLSVLFMPRTLATDAKTEAALERFVRDGGTLVCESECGAYDSRGLYRYPAERFTARLSGLVEAGRRAIVDDQVTVSLGDEQLRLKLSQWTTPWTGSAGTSAAACADGSLLSVVPVGKGRLVLCGSFLGDAYLEKSYPDFERFVRLLCGQAGWKPQIEATGVDGGTDRYVFVKHGMSGSRRMVFLLAAGGVSKVQLSLLDAGLVRKHRLSDLISGKSYELAASGSGLGTAVEVGEWGVAALVEEG